MKGRPGLHGGGRGAGLWPRSSSPHVGPQPGSGRCAVHGSSVLPRDLQGRRASGGLAITVGIPFFLSPQQNGVLASFSFLGYFERKSLEPNCLVS